MCSCLLADFIRLRPIFEHAFIKPSSEGACFIKFLRGILPEDGTSFFIDLERSGAGMMRHFNAVLATLGPGVLANENEVLQMFQPAQPNTFPKAFPSFLAKQVMILCTLCQCARVIIDHHAQRFPCLGVVVFPQHLHIPGRTSVFIVSALPRTCLWLRIFLCGRNSISPPHRSFHRFIRPLPVS